MDKADAQDEAETIIEAAKAATRRQRNEAATTVLARCCADAAVPLDRSASQGNSSRAPAG